MIWTKKCKFQTSWQKYGDWLEYCTENNTMKCAEFATTDIERKAVFVTGLQNFKLDSLILIKIQSCIKFDWCVIVCPYCHKCSGFSLCGHVMLHPAKHLISYYQIKSLP